jgi:hypothetical protein
VRRLVLVAVASLSLGLAGFNRARLVDRRVEQNLAVRAGSGTGLPPSIALLHAALGPFRGLATGYLWMRAIRLSEEGRTFEALEVAEAICRLQPRLDDVWDFRAYELAYNVCAAVDEPEARWLWITNGISLLRDQALPLNPRSALLHHSLARIYQDRIGGPFDDHHQFFKGTLASEVATVMGDHPDLAALARAPRTRQDLEKSDPAAWALLARIDARGGDNVVGPDDPARSDPAWPKLEPFLRARAVRTILKLDPELVFEVDRDYGPLDWRWCDTHALYWTVLGSRLALAQGGPEGERAQRKLERASLRAVRSCMRRGRVLDLGDGHFSFAPEPRLAVRLDDLHVAAIDRIKVAIAQGKAEAAADVAEDEEGEDHGDVKARSAEDQIRVLGEARGEALAESISLLLQYGRDSEAKKLFERLKTVKPDLARTPFDRFADDLLAQELAQIGEEGGGTQSRIQGMLDGAWTRHYLALSLGDDEKALALAALAQRIYEGWQREIAKKVKNENDRFAAQRLGAELKLANRNGLANAAQRLPPALRKRLADRLGKTPAELDALVQELRSAPKKAEAPK